MMSVSFSWPRCQIGKTKSRPKSELVFFFFFFLGGGAGGLRRAGGYTATPNSAVFVH